MANPNDILRKVYQNASKHFSLPDFDTFQQDMMDEKKRRSAYEKLQSTYDLPDFDTFSHDIGAVAPPTPAQPTAQAQPQQQTVTPTAQPIKDTAAQQATVESGTTPAQPAGWTPSPMQQRALQIQMDEANARLKKQGEEFQQRMEGIEKGNRPGAFMGEREFNPQTGQMETAYYTTQGDRMPTQMQQSKANADYHQWWENNTEAGQRSKEQRLQREFDDRLSSLWHRHDPVEGENAVEQAWSAAEARQSAARNRNAKRNWDSYSAMGGGREMRVVTASMNRHEDMVDRFTNFDLDRLMNDSWDNLGEDGQKALIDDCYQMLRYRNPGADELELYGKAKEFARQQSNLRLYNLAVERNRPQSEVGYLLRKIGDMNMLMNISKGLAVSSAGGKTGDMPAYEAANEEYRQDGHRILDVTGTVAGFALDPTTWLSAGVGSAATRSAMWVGGRYLAGRGAAAAVTNAATRQFATSMTGRVVGGVVGGAANFGMFEGLKEVESQFVHGGHIAGQDEIGRYINEGYSASAVAGQAAHGFLMGGAIGWLTPVSGNVADKLVRSTSSTGLKTIERAGVYSGATMLEGTIFSVPEWIEGSRDAMDVWTDNMAMMVGFKAKHMLKSAGNVLGDLKASFESPANGGKNRLDFESRLRMRMDTSSDGGLSLTKDEEAELQRYGYNLRDLVESAERTGEAKKGGLIAENAPEIVSRLTEMVNDPRISEAARAKMYYYATGRKLPVSTVMKGELIEDGEGGFIVESQGANGVITSRSFKSRKSADLEMERIKRQAELNHIEIGERYQQTADFENRLQEACRTVAAENGWDMVEVYRTCEDARRNHLRGGDKQFDEAQQNILRKVTEAMGEFEETGVTDNMRGCINDKYGVDIDNAIRKEANRRTKAEQTAIDEYLDVLIPKNAKERNTVEDAEAEDITNQKLLTDEPEATTPTNDAPIDPRFGNPTTPEYDPHQPGGEQKPVGRAVMKYQDRPVEVLSGRVVMMEDDTMIDNKRSDASIVVRDLETGKVEMVSPDAILSYEGYPAEVEVSQANVAPEAETPAEPQPKYTTGQIKIRNSDGTETRGVLTGFVDENGNHEYYVEGDLQHLHYASEHELDNILSEYTPDEPQEVKQPQPTEPQPVDPNRPTQEGVANVEDYDKGYTFGINETQGISDSELTAKIDNLRNDAERLTDFGRGMLEAYEYEQQRRAMEQQLVPVDAETIPKTEETAPEPTETSENITETVPNTEIPVENVQQPAPVAPITNEAPQVENAPASQTEPTAQPTPLQRIPRNEKKEPIFEQAESPEIGWDALVEFSEGDAATAKEIADTMVEEKRKAFEKAQKLKPKGKTPAEILASKKANTAELTKAQAEYEQWQRMAGVENARQSAIRSQQEAEARRLAAERAEAEKAEREAREEAARLEREALEGIPEWHMDTPENARKRGVRRFSGQMFTRQEPVQGVVGNEVEVKFSQKDLPKGRVAVIEASQLQPSHVQGQRNPLFFIDEAQPKNRAEAVSMYAAKEMAEGIRPQEITGSATAYTGAPTVNTRGEVIQGNNRSDALRFLWENNLPTQQQTYKQYLLDNAEQFGINPEAVNDMQHPVLVNMLDVDDTEAIRLGQMTAQDTESGGIERIKPKNVAQKLGEDMRTFANQLLRTSDEEASFGQLVDRNGTDVLKWMNQVGAISNTQYQSAFDSKGNLTAEVKNDLQKVLYQAVFKGASPQLEEMFDKLPAKAQRAILSTAFRDMDSPFAGKMLPEIQASIAAYNQLMSDPAFVEAKNMEQVSRAIFAFKSAIALDDRFEQYMPADNFSNFALHLAGMYKASDMSQSTIASYFNQMYDFAQGKKAATLFEEADTTEYPLAEVINKVLNIQYQPAKNGNNNVSNGGADVALRNRTGQDGEPRGSEPPASREQTEAGAEPSERGGGITGDSRGSGNIGNGGESQETTQQERLTKEAASGIIAEMEQRATVAPELELTIENWDAQFGENGIVSTPIGEVKMGENQFTKLMRQGRNGKLGMIRSTLEDPDIIIEDASEAKDNQTTERESSFVFVKTFTKPDGSRYYYFTSVTVSKDGHEVVVSNQEKRRNVLTNLLMKGKLVWKHADNVSPASDLADGLYSSQGNLSDPASEGTDAPQTNNVLSDRKVTNSASYKQENSAESSVQPTDNKGVQTIQTAVEAASSEVNTEPTPAQAEAGNYKKGHVTIGEFDITIENHVGSVRKGVDADGKEWSNTMANTYGYIKGTEGVDGDHIDVFLHENMDLWNGRKVYVVDQTNTDGSFDEHKVMLGFNDKEEAMSAYLANYDATWGQTHPGLRISETNIEDFNKWVQSSHRKTKPFADYSTVSKITDEAPVEQPSQPAAAITGNGYQVEPKPYTNKQGKTLDTYLVTFDRDFSKEELSALRAKAKALKGWYDRESKGWMLRSVDDAKAFAEEVATKSEDEVADEAPLSISDLGKPADTPVKKVDVASVTDALKTKGEAKLSDHAEPVESPKPKKRRWISDEDADEFNSLRDNLRNHFGKGDDIVNESGAEYGQPKPKQMDAEVLRMGTRMTYLMMKGGLRSFADYCEAMKDELPDIFDDMRPHLKSLYAAAQNMEEVMQLGWDEEMDDRKTVKAFDVYNFDKPGAKDIIATAQHTVDERTSQQQTDQIIQTLKNQRNEQRKKEADKTSADTEAVVSKAETTADEVESNLEAATTEQDAERLSRSLDKELEEVNKQLALLGYYEADTVDKDFNEAYGYMRNAERKAVQDAHRLATQLANDLGITIDPKDKVHKSKYGFGSKIARSNVAPAGGEVYITLPLTEGRELSIWLSLDKNESWREGGRQDRYDEDLMLTGIMYRVENTGKGGMSRYESSNHNSQPTISYDELLSDIRRLVRSYLPDEQVKPATPLTPQPGEDMVKMAERVAKSKAPKKSRIPDEQPMNDLFGGLFDEAEPKQDSAQFVKDMADMLERGESPFTVTPEVEAELAKQREAENNSTTPKNNSHEKTDVQPRTEETGRGGQQPRPNEPLGEGAKHEDERTDGGRMAQRSGVHSVFDSGRSARVSGQHQSERGVTGPKNTRNNHAERGMDYAPKGEKARIDANLAAIEVAKKLLASGETATPKEMEVLRRYSGWGGLGSAFNEGSTWSPNPINKRLREILTPEEYEAAVMSRNSAYYTPASVIDAMWDIAKALGFKGGNIVEGSAGIGNIIGLMPTEISERSNIHAVEIDNTTGGILSLLYPDAKVEVQGFEKTRIANGSVDLTITNVPFVTGLHVMDESGDSDLSKKFRDIHDFCIAKNVRKLREGGIGIFITSSGTLDKSQKLRNWLVGDKEGCADVVGVFRMNNQTFGGTAATSDIIVVRKRVNGRKSANAIDVSTVTPARTASFEDDRGKTKDLPMLINRYFIEHPEYMGGEMYFGFEQGDTYRPTSMGLFPTRTADQPARMAAWVQYLAEMDWSKEQGTAVAEQTSHINEALGKDVKEGSMVTDSNGNLCVARMGRAVPLTLNKNKIKGRTKEQCFADYTDLKNVLADVLKYQTEHNDDAGLQPLLDRLNSAYDTFVARYGNLNKNNNLAWLRNDVDFSSIVALETYSEKGSKDGTKIKTYGKTDIFSRRVVERESEPAPKNVKDGIIASLYKYGRIDPEYLASQLGKSQADVKQEIIESGLGFENPTTGQMEVSYEYLSGNVRVKLRQAREANEAANGAYDANIKALEAVVPMNIPAHLIEFTLGSSWVDPKLYERFVKERTDLNVRLTNAGGTWHMSEPYWTDEPKNKEMGIRSESLGILIPGHKLIEAAITNKTITVSKTYKNSDGTTTTETDAAATTACATKVDEIRQDFKDWAREQMQNDPELSMRMEEVYNEKFNNSMPKSIPDEFVPEHFGGAATMVGGRPFRLRPHQAKAVIRATTQPVLLAHEVGTGKTYTLITTAMEMRRLGTARKPMIVVQNATVGQFVASAKALYPNAKVLTLEDADRNAEGRRAFYAKIKFNDWDMIVVPQSVFERIPDSVERQTQFIQDKIEEKMLVLDQMKDADTDGKSMIVRAAEREIEKLKDEISQLANGGATDKKKEKDAKKAAVTRQNAEVKAREMLDRATDDVEDFDSMGIDAILVDEAHEYKHLGFATAMQRGVKGVDPSFSKKSQGVFLKAQAVLEKTGGKNVVFATGTPISNTAAEIWTFMRYLMPADVMKDYGIYYFDDFVRNFGNLQQMLEFSTSGKYKENNRFAGYVNLPELVRIWSTVADTVLTREAGGVSDKIPQMEGGKAQDIFLPQTRALRSIMKFVKEQLDAYDNMSGKEKKENSHIPLVMYGIAKAAAVDARLVQSDAEDDPNSKTNEAVRQTLRTLEEAKDYNGTVAIFADNYQNKASGFNLYEDIRKKLIAAGVPEEQIVVMKSGMTVNKKLEIFSRVNAGEVRVIMGSTFTLGTGVNIQERLHTLIHLDAPNRPMDYTQRNGRILRQGNLHNEWGIPVRVLRFGVEDSLDVTAYQRLKTKGAIADSIMNGKQLMENSMENRALEEDQDLFGDITAQLSGSEYAMLKNQIEKEVRKLTAQRKSWEADQTYIHNRKRQIAGQNKEAEKRIAENKSYLEKVEAATVGDITVGKLSYPSVEAMEDFFTEQNKRKAELQEQVRKSGYSSRPATSDITISVGGFNFHVHTEINRETKQGQQGDLFYSAPAKMTYSCPELGIEAMPVKGNVIKNAVTEILNDVVSGEDFRGRIEAAERSIERNNAELQSISARDGVPFKFTEELAKAEEKLSEYEDLMKAEMEAKEAKYAELDKEVEAASNIELTEEDSEDAASEPIASYSEENANFASRYETQDGKTINYTSENTEGYGGLFDFDFSGENAGGNEVGMRSGANDLQRQGDTGLNRHDSRLDKETGEFSHVERIFRENGSFNFTSGEKIESADDVAFIFSALEDAAKEHSFVVLVKDGKPTVVELGMGTFTATMVDIPTASLAYNRIQPDQVYFVHNHPSGNLMCSPQDVQMLRKIADISKVPVYGVIINLKTGKYGTFDTDNTSGVGQKRVPENESPLAVHTLDKQIFAPNYDPMEQPLVRGSKDVAKFLNSQRMGDRAKMSFIILSRAGRIVGNIHTPFTKLPAKSDEIARYISERVIQFGGESAILYGDFTHEGSKMVAYRNLKDNLNKVGGTTLLDVVNVEGNNTRSANDDGLLYDPGSEYGASTEAKSSHAERMSKKFNTPIRIVTDTKELTNDNSERQARMRRSKGFYDPATGEVVIVLPNNANVEDVAETVFHEVVAHKGLREMIGEENYDAFCDEIYKHFKDDLKRQVDKEISRRFVNEPGKGYEHHRRVAVDEMFGRMSEKGFEDFTKAERGIWVKLKAKVLEAINKFLGSLKLPKWVKLGDNELRYMLWRSHEKLRTKGDYVDMARDAAKRDELGLSSDARFRDGETGDIWKDQSIGLEERITNAAIRLSNNQSADLTLRNDAMRAVTNNLQSLLHSMRNRRGTAQSFVGADRKVEAGVVDAMNAQAMFDRSTVKRVSDLARILMQNGYLSGMTSGEMQRLLSAVKNATAMHDIADSVQKIMDIMVDNQLRNGEVSLRQLLAIRGSKVDARGVEVQGALDVDGQRTMEVVKKAISLTEDDITDRIAEALNRMSDPDQTIADQAAIEYAGLNMALDYVQNIANSKAEEKALRDSLKTAKEDRDAGRMTDDAYKQFIETTEDAIRKNKIERTEAYFNLVGRLSDSLRGSIENAKAFREAEKARISEIHHNANSDMEGRPTNEHHKDDWQDKFVNNGFVQFLFAPLGTFDQIMRVFGNKSANGEGYLWNRFMRGWVDCRNKELRGIKDKFAQLDEKAAELFGKSKTWGDIIRMERKLPKASVSFWDGGEMRDHELTQGNLLYIYMVDKMTDGRMKLRRMGITEQNVADIENFLDPRFKALGDWLQDDFLVATRNEYNETHKRMFGASMAAIENYFPLKILANARVDKEEDVNQQNRPDGITTKTGSIIKRRVNNLALDITGADALSVILDHITQMEHWSAYAEWNRDLNTLRTYKRFRNQVINMTTVYGGGRRLWENFNDLCLMAAGEYRPPIANLDKSAVNLAKGVTAAKVSFRMFTALKQLLSAPAYAPEVSTRAILKSIVNPYGDFKWCMENLPIFRERWHSRISGDPRLLKSDMDWKMWRSRVMELSSRIGMTPNAFVDAVTVSIGAKAMYETRLKQYIKEGYPTDAAEKRAMQDAAILFNQTQQSSESPFLSTMQVDRSWLSVLFTVFRNSAMSYTRQEFDAVRNLKRNLTPGQRAKSIEFMTKQILRDWNVDPESATDVERDKAEGAAKKRFRKQIKKDVIRLATFGFILEMAWNLGSYLPYIIFGDDEDEKDKMWDDAITHAYFGSVEGLSGGDVLSSFGNMWANGEWNRNQLSKDMPLASDINSIANKFIGGKNAEGINDIINLLVQMGVGMNPQSITDAAIAITDACGDDPALSHEAAIFVMRVLQVPQSQIDKMYFDEIGLSGEEASKLTPEQLAQRYAEYKVKRGTPLAPWSWGDEERLNKYSESAKDIMKERLDAQGDATVNEAYADFEARYKAVSEKAKEAKALMRTDYAAAAQAHAALQQDPDFTLYQRFGSLDKQLGRISKMWLTSKTPEEAALIASTIPAYRAGMVKVLQAETVENQQSAMSELTTLMNEFYSKYQAIQPQPQQLNR
jgi:N12 class adenine-specific DNA methylase